MKRNLLIGLSLLVLAVGAGAAYAVGHAGRGGMMKQMISTRIAKAEDYINATPDQRAVIEASKQNVFKALDARKQNRQQNHGQIVALLTADKLDTAALYALADQHAQEVKDLAQVIVPEIQKIHDVLTPAQRQMLADKAKQMHDRKQQGGFGGPGE